MILRGVIEHTFGGALCFRGFARIGDLAKISKSKETYQRVADKKRASDILEFLKNSEFRFFPELIFGLNFEDSNAIQNILLGKGNTFSDNISFTPIRRDFTDYEKSDKFGSPVLRRITLDFKDENRKYLSRIDGNHRLSAIDIVFNNIENYSSISNNENAHNIDIDEKNRIISEYNETIKSIDYLVPFNILLQNKNEDSERSETAYFHLINSKSTKLTSEENLKSIFDSELFNENQLVNLLGQNALQARELYENLTSYSFHGIELGINGLLRSFCLDAVNILKNKESIDVMKLQNSIQQLDMLFADDEKLQTTTNINIILAFVFFKYSSDKDSFLKFTNWVKTNQIFELNEIKAKSVIKIFTQVHEKRKYQIFVAMPYWSHAEVTEYNNLFKEICIATSKKLNVEVELIPIMRFSGKSQRIDARLIEKIKECNVFIADITGCNQNVIFEVGYAEGQNKPMILIKAEQDETLSPFDMDKLQYIPYDKNVYYNAIKGIITRNLSELLKKEFKIN